MEWYFFKYFYVPFHFFKVPFDFACLPKAAFCKDKAHRGTPKEGKMSLLFFSNRTAIFLCNFMCHLIFLKISFHFAWLPKAAFCKDNAHRGTPKEGKMSLLFFSNRTAIFLCYFMCHFIFFKNPFPFCLASKSSILQG